MSKLLKETWKRLAFGKGNQSLNEMYDRFHSLIPLELWQLNDYEVYRDSGINLAQFKIEELELKKEQLLEEIEDEMNHMDDPQNQYDQTVAMKEALIDAIQKVIDQAPPSR